MEKLYDKLLTMVIDEIGIGDMDRHEAECIALAWLLKTKLYMIEETSRKWSERGIRLFQHEINLCHQ